MTRSMKQAALALIALLLAGPAAAAPKVVADIAPLHSLVARVMQGVGQPALILPPGASPHTYAMRPSEAAALADADMVFWIGSALEPWLGRAIASLAPGATSVALLDAAGTTLLPMREDPGDAPETHTHGATDPHAWLDPRNARAWLGVIADKLAGADPANAAVYARNAADGQAEIDALSDEIAATLAPVHGAPFVVYHDAYQYFGSRFGMDAAGAISPGDASGPGAARIAVLRDKIARTGARCVFAEPQFPASLVETVTEGTEARVATLDLLGATLSPGPALYPMLMRRLAAGMASCLGGT